MKITIQHFKFDTLVNKSAECALFTPNRQKIAFPCFSSAESHCDSQRLSYAIPNFCVISLCSRRRCRKLFVQKLAPLKFMDRLASNFM